MSLKIIIRRARLMHPAERRPGEYLPERDRPALNRAYCLRQIPPEIPL